MVFDKTYSKALKGSSSAIRKLAVCSGVGAALSLSVVLGDESSRDQWLFMLVAGGAMGLIAGSFLVLRDTLRNRNLRWRAKLEERARQLLDRGEAKDQEEALRSAQVQVAEETSGCIVWFGMIVGGFMVLCAVIMFVIKLIEGARRGT